MINAKTAQILVLRKDRFVCNQYQSIYSDISKMSELNYARYKRMSQMFL